MNSSGSNALIETLNQCLEKSHTAPLTLGEVLDSIKEAGFCFISLILVLPLLTPVSLGPLATIGGLTFAVLGWQLYRGHAVPVLPAKVRAAKISPKTWETLIGVGIKFITLCKKFTRPRYQYWVTGDRGRRVMGIIIMSGGLLMAIPFFGLPLNNALPGLAIFSVCVAELEDDGIMVFVAIGWLVVTVIYFTAILIAIWTMGIEALGFLR